jgi:hypothetical protein
LEDCTTWNQSFKVPLVVSGNSGSVYFDGIADDAAAIGFQQDDNTINMGGQQLMGNGGVDDVGGGAGAILRHELLSRQLSRLLLLRREIWTSRLRFVMPARRAELCREWKHQT